jgi:DNA-binding HxlR family transcriptional regulator
MKNQKWKQIKKLDELDNILLYLISCGGNTLTYLTNVLGQPKQTLSDRVSRLNILNLVESVENNEKYIYRKYILTDQGQNFIKSMDIISNIILLNSRK